MGRAWEWRCCRSGRGAVEGESSKRSVSRAPGLPRSHPLARGARSRVREGLTGGGWTRGGCGCGPARRSSAEALEVFWKCCSLSFPLIFPSCPHSGASRSVRSLLFWVSACPQFLTQSLVLLTICSTTSFYLLFFSLFSFVIPLGFGDLSSLTTD